MRGLQNDFSEEFAFCSMGNETGEVTLEYNFQTCPVATSVKELAMCVQTTGTTPG